MGFVQDYIDALRSGEYKQITSVLSADVNGVQCFCAQGVALDVAIKGNYVTGYSWVRSSAGSYRWLYQPSGKKGKFTVPNAVYYLASDIIDDFEWDAITNLNDSGGKSLESIADYVESLLPDGE